MAIDFEKAPEEQMTEETGPVLERPLHFEDEEIEDTEGYVLEPDKAPDLADEDAPVEEGEN